LLAKPSSKKKGLKLMEGENTEPESN
jgi:hypothetical protein